MSEEYGKHEALRRQEELKRKAKLKPKYLQKNDKETNKFYDSIRIENHVIKSATKQRGERRILKKGWGFTIKH